MSSCDESETFHNTRKMSSRSTSKKSDRDVDIKDDSDTHEISDTFLNINVNAESSENKMSNVENVEDKMSLNKNVQGHYRSSCTPQFDNINETLINLVGWASSHQKHKRALSSNQCAELITKFETIRNTVKLLESRVTYLEGRLDERLEIDKLVNTVPHKDMTLSGKTYSDIVKFPKVTGIKNKIITPKVLFIRSKDDKQSMDDIKNTIKSSIKPSKLGVNIKRVMKTARGVLIETENDNHLEKLEKSDVFLNNNLVIEKPRKKLPRLLIYDVDKHDDVDETIEDIYRQNLNNTNIDLDTFKKEFKCVHQYKKRDPTDTRTNWVIECSANVRNIIRIRDRLYIGWQSCRVKDFNPLVRCFKCQSYGHISKFCKNNSVCPHCSEEHELSICPNKDKAPTCPNCHRVKKESNHALGSSGCPELIRATRIAHERIDYGN